jgi:protein involved in polysaccharide export with SLBB domain
VFFLAIIRRLPKVELARRGFSVIFISIAATLIAGGQPPADTTAGLIHLGDLVDVDVVGSLEFDWRGTLTPEGYLERFDKIEEQIYALCRSEQAVADDIAKNYAKMLRSLKVVVRIVDRSRRAVAVVDGAVRTPHRFQIRRPVHLRELLVLAGGLTDTTSGEIRVYRPDGLSCSEKSGGAVPEFLQTSHAAGLRTRVIAVTDLIKGIPEADPLILSGDLVTVLDAAPIYITGGVANPRQISSRKSVTLSRAIAMAGGLADDAVEDQITILRREANTATSITADLRKITKKQADDPLLKPYDIINVPQKGRGKPVFPLGDEPLLAGERSASALPLRIVD